MVSSCIIDSKPTTTKKKNTGRKKIDIKKIEKTNTLQVTFSKRRTGLFKKASELRVLTGAQVAIFVNSPAGRMYVFGHPDVDSLIEKALHLQENNNNNVSLPMLPENGFNQSYEELLKEFDAGNTQTGMIVSAGSNESGINDNEFLRDFDAEKMWNEMIMSTGSKESGSNDDDDGIGFDELLRELDSPNEIIVSSDNGLGLDECIDGMDLEQLQNYLCQLQQNKYDVEVRANEVMLNNFYQG